MKADSAAQRRLLDLAAVDAELTRVNHRRRTLPELAEITEVERSLQAKRDAVVAAETILGDLEREVTRMETEVDQVRAREDRDRKLLDSGGVSAKQLEDLQHELETLQRRQGVLEDELLELMERREAVEFDVRHAKEELSTAEGKLADATRRKDEALGELETAEARHDGERKTIAGQLPAELVMLYEKIRAQRGTGAAPLRARRCGACRLELDRTALGALRSAAADAVARCEECGVILVRTGESGL